MNFLDTYDITRSTTPTPAAAPQEQQPSLNEEVNQVIGQFSRFWGGFKKQSRTAIETARKDFSDVVVQAQKELSKLTATEEGQGSSTTLSDSNNNSTAQPETGPEASASASESDPNASNSEEQASTSTAGGNETPKAAASTSTQGLFARLQAALPPNVVATVQNNIPESLKHASENIDLNQIRTNLLTEFQRVQGVTLAQAEEYVHKSEILIRDAVKEAGEVLRDAVKIVPPEQGGGAAAGGSGLMWDGMDMWMLPYETNETASTSTGKDGSRGIPESQSAVASRAEALVRRLKCDPSILRHDPEGEEGAKEQFEQWRQAEVETKDGGLDGDEWKSKIAATLEETDGESLKQTMATLVPSEMAEATFWLRYFFRAHQIHVEQEKRKALLLQSTTDNDDDFSWEDDEDETSPTSTKPPPAKSTLEIPQKSKVEIPSPPDSSHPGTVATPSPRLSREGSFDVISSNVSLAGDEKPAAPASKPSAKDDDDSGDSDWE